MKQALRKTIALVLSMVLVLSCAGIAFADTPSVPQTKVKAERIEKAEPAVPAKTQNETDPSSDAVAAVAADAAEPAATAATDFKYYTRTKDDFGPILTGKEKLIQSHVRVLEIDQNDIVGKSPDSASLNIVGHSTKVHFPARGSLLLGGANIATTGSKSFYMGLYKDKAMTQPINSITDEEYLSANSSKDAYQLVQVPKSGDYYIGVHATNGASYPTTFKNAIGVLAYYINGYDRTLKNNTYTTVGRVDAKANGTNYTFFKFTAPSTGYAKVYFDTHGASNEVALMNAGKQRVSTIVRNKDQRVFGVKKGGTYYVRVRVPYDYLMNNSGGYRIKVTTTYVPESSGASRTSAKVLNRLSSNAKKGSITATSGASTTTDDWYKINLTSKRNFKVTMKGQTNDKMTLSIYNNKGKLIKSSTMTSPYYVGTTISLYNYAKGTYYVRISKGNTNSSGHYSVYWFYI